MFEEVYGGGGMIPINKDFEVVTSKVEDQKITDFVLPEFVDLLKFTQNIIPERQRRYEEHDLQQKQWEEHFLERYGEVVEQPEVKEASNEAGTDNIPQQEKIDDALSGIANMHGAKIYSFTLSNGTTVSIASNVEEMLRYGISQRYQNMPKVFIDKFSNYILKQPQANEDFLLAYACHSNDMNKWGQFVAENGKYSKEEREELNAKIVSEIKSQIMSDEEVAKTIDELYDKFEQQNPQFIKLARHAIMEYSTRLITPDEDYLKSVIDMKFNNMLQQPEYANLPPEEKLSAYAAIFRQTNEGINSMRSHEMPYLDTKSLEAGLAFLSIGNQSEDQSIQMDKIMQKYRKPLSSSERFKISKAFVSILLDMKPDQTQSLKGELSGFFLCAMEALRKNSNLRKEFAQIVYNKIVTEDNTTLRYLLEKDADKNLSSAKVEYEFTSYIKDHMGLFKRLASYDKSAMEKYIRPDNPDLYNMLMDYRDKIAAQSIINMNK